MVLIRIQSIVKGQVSILEEDWLKGSILLICVVASEEHDAKWIIDGTQESIPIRFEFAAGD